MVWWMFVASAGRKSSAFFRDGDTLCSRITKQLSSCHTKNNTTNDLGSATWQFPVLVSKGLHPFPHRNVPTGT